MRDAATVMLVRDGPTGLEVLMVQRNLHSDFVGGAHVFPGGAVDDADRESTLEGLCLASGAGGLCLASGAGGLCLASGAGGLCLASGEVDAACSARLGLDTGGMALFVAAVRECFEEAGVLLARRAGDERVLSLGDPQVAARFTAHRAAVDGGRPLAEVLVEEGLVLDVDRLHYVSHWITPEGAPRRYDTRFFVAEAPPEQVPLHDERETVASVWIAPAEALARHRRGEVDLILPTIRNLEDLARHESVTALVAEAQAIQNVPTIQPRLVNGSEGLRIVLPGDDGYDDPDGDRGADPWPVRPGSREEGLR